MNKQRFWAGKILSSEIAFTRNQQRGSGKMCKNSALVLELVVEIKGELLNSRRWGTSPRLLYIQMTTKLGRPLLNKMLILKVASNRQSFFREAFKKKEEKKSLMLKNETEGKEHQRSKIWSGIQIKKTGRRLNPRREDDEMRWARRETKAGGKTIGRPGNERREEKEREETRDYEWRRRGKVFTLCVRLCVCASVGGAHYWHHVLPQEAPWENISTQEDQRGTASRGRDRDGKDEGSEANPKSPQLQMYMCVCVCASVGVRVSGLCFSVLAAVHLCHTSAMKSKRQFEETDSRSDKETFATTTQSELYWAGMARGFDRV